MDAKKKSFYLLATLCKHAISILTIACLPLMAQSWQSVSKDVIDITLGDLTTKSDGRLNVNVPKFRAHLHQKYPPTAKLSLRYLGETSILAPLSSGRVVGQIGLKLINKNTCNVLYVMWRIMPVEELYLAVKHNPDDTTHKECGANGYHGLSYTKLSPFGISAKDGKTHELYATFSAKKQTVSVYIDDKLIEKKRIDSKLLAGLTGTIGLRSDNANVDFRFLLPMAEKTLFTDGFEQP